MRLSTDPRAYCPIYSARFFFECGGAIASGVATALHVLPAVPNERTASPVLDTKSPCFLNSAHIVIWNKILYKTIDYPSNNCCCKTLYIADNAFCLKLALSYLELTSSLSFDINS